MGTRAHRWVMGLTLAAACQLGWVWAEAAAPLIRVAQVVARGATVTAYLDLRDSDGRVAEGISAAQLGATLGARPAVVTELVPVAETGEGIAYIFLVDISKSLTQAQFALLKTALGEWIAGLRPLDRAALVSFGKGVRLVEDFTTNAGALTAAVERLAPTDSQTFFHQGLLTALTLGQRRDVGLPERRAIVTLTEGIDDVAGGVSAEEVYAQLREGRIPSTPSASPVAAIMPAAMPGSTHWGSSRAARVGRSATPPAVISPTPTAPCASRSPSSTARA